MSFEILHPMRAHLEPAFQWAEMLIFFFNLLIYLFFWGGRGTITIKKYGKLGVFYGAQTFRTKEKITDLP